MSSQNDTITKLCCLAISTAPRSNYGWSIAAYHLLERNFRNESLPTGITALKYFQPNLVLARRLMDSSHGAFMVQPHSMGIQELSLILGLGQNTVISDKLLEKIFRGFVNTLQDELIQAFFPIRSIFTFLTSLSKLQTIYDNDLEAKKLILNLKSRAESEGQIYREASRGRNSHTPE